MEFPPRFPPRGAQPGGDCWQGYELYDQDRGPQGDDADGEFRGQRDGHDRVKFEIVCRGGAPALVQEHED